jgi:hypothetical protein
MILLYVAANSISIIVISLQIYWYTSSRNLVCVWKLLCKCLIHIQVTVYARRIVQSQIRLNRNFCNISGYDFRSLFSQSWIIVTITGTVAIHSSMYQYFIQKYVRFCVEMK